MKPIIFSTDMIKAIREGRKTQTRRVVKYQKELNFFSGRADDTAGDSTDLEMRLEGDILRYWNMEYPEEGALTIKCPYGKVGDRLWVREACFIGGIKPNEWAWYKAGFDGDVSAVVWCPSIHMPRWASRITLEITGIRIERLQEITEDDAEQEGVSDLPYMLQGDSVPKLLEPITVWHFRDKWDSINGKKHPWESNPWVWVIKFKEVV